MKEKTSQGFSCWFQILQL